MTFNTRHLPWGGLVLGWSVGHLRRLVRLAALGWSDRLAHVGISVFAETVVARRRRHMLLLAFVLPVARMHRQQAPYISNTAPESYNMLISILYINVSLVHLSEPQCLIKYEYRPWQRYQHDILPPVCGEPAPPTLSKYLQLYYLLLG